ncbi:MAG: 16S rRNA (cytidine(1402)-2'-O)-methyltransferase [Bacillota bacterium]|nr:16S rRNA (cytidine(1402)-2'-O)-methyltransferase [Bacillota bacterium]
MLYFVPTPIGNLGDMTLRAIETLKKVDVIYAEDTRRTKQLLNHFEIDGRLRSYHEHNKDKVGEEVLEELREGREIALVSDAGMPCISDPGLQLVRACVEAGISFTVLPGATAFATAFAASGIDANTFSFMGFLPKTSRHKKQVLAALSGEVHPYIFYESPHALQDTLRAMNEILGNRKIFIGRELTKLHEEYLRGDIAEMIRHFEEVEPRGEFVLVVEGAKESKDADAKPESGGEIGNPLIDVLLARDFSVKDIAEIVSEVTGERKKSVYNRVLEKIGKK